MCAAGRGRPWPFRPVALTLAVWIDVDDEPEVLARLGGLLHFLCSVVGERRAWLLLVVVVVVGDDDAVASKYRLEWLVVVEWWLLSSCKWINQVRPSLFCRRCDLVDIFTRVGVFTRKKLEGKRNKRCTSLTRNKRGK